MARKVGKKRNVIVAKIETFKNKQEIVKNKMRLGNKPVFINNDMTVKERGIQRNLRNRAREERGKGK